MADHTVGLFTSEHGARVLFQIQGGACIQLELSLASKPDFDVDIATTVADSTTSCPSTVCAQGLVACVQ
jgi:hypothetical protein